jgi:glutamine synthetase
VSPPELVALVCCDLAAIVRGRSVFASELESHVRAGVGWVPANHALLPLGGLAEPNPFGSVGDLRLLPEPATRARVGAEPGATAFELLLCDIVETDGRPWACCPRSFLREALADLREQTGGELWASFEHEFQLPRMGEPSALPFSLDGLRRAEPFATAVMGALVEAGAEPERFFAEYASHQFEIPVAAAPGLAAADRAVLMREVVREMARRDGMRASFAPLLDLEEAGNGVHIHISLEGADGDALFHDEGSPEKLSPLAGSFAAGVLRHAGALSAICAPSPVSGERLRPHRWSAGAVCLAARNREALLRIPPLVELDGTGSESQLRLEFRGADACANPHLALGALVRAGLDGIAEGLPTPPVLDRDPASLDAGEAERFGVGALPTTLAQALEELERDEAAKGWLGEPLYDAYVSLKRSELEAVRELDLLSTCRRYGEVY